MRKRAFTLVELLVVIGIIALLIGITIPVVSKVRQSAYVADSKNWINQLSSAIERYHSDFRAYPGPLHQRQLNDTSGVTAVSSDPGFETTFTADQITGAENLVLGLLGGMTATTSGTIQYKPSVVGNGPMNLNPNNPKRYAPYMEATNLSWRTENDRKTGQYKDDGGSAADTIIPEFVDRFPEPMPVLYLRSRAGQGEVVSFHGKDSGGTALLGLDINGNPIPTNYDIREIIAYTDTTIGSGRKLPKYAGGSVSPKHGLRTVNTSSSMAQSPPAGFTYVSPADAYAYFSDPNKPRATVAAKTDPRRKDSYILISAGKDRVYGTADDIANFGEVGQ